MARNIFITATDTDAGKTFFATALVKALAARNKKVAVYKPISAGCQLENFQDRQQLVNEDAKLLLLASNCQQSLGEVNPIAFEPAIAPHIAAEKENQRITLNDVQQGFDRVLQNKADVTITEGAGGWRLPLGNGVFLSEFAQKNQHDVILVVNMKLGCLNHALLTYQAIINDGLTVVGWVANSIDDMPFLAENLQELERLIPAPKIAQLSFTDIDSAASRIDLSIF